MAYKFSIKTNKPVNLEKLAAKLDDKFTRIVNVQEADGKSIFYRVVTTHSLIWMDIDVEIYSNDPHWVTACIELKKIPKNFMYFLYLLALFDAFLLFNKADVKAVLSLSAIAFVLVGMSGFAGIEDFKRQLRSAVYWLD